ncbi:MAG: CapA family protein [Alphaproteobacteria bacterium]|nr:CapA family protein [Alphaproteobacteria bacterium]
MLFVLATHTALAVPPPLAFPSASGCDGRAVDIAMVGDLMQHGEQLKASQRGDGTTTWQGVFDAVAPMLRGADLTIGNLETPIDSSQPYGGFPFFNAPESMLVALRDAGFDVLQTANNHCLDKGRRGALATLEAVRGHGFGTAGTWKSAEERGEPWVLRDLPGDIRVAFLANTYGTNGQPMPEGEPWLVNWLDAGQMQHDIARAREHADIVIVGLHWGGEYKHAPTAEQRATAKSLVEAGADIVMGTHPHVLQPAEVVTVEDPGGHVRDGVVLYSLGNFVSNQRTFPRDGGVIARVTLQRCGQDVRATDARFTPVWVDDRVEGAASKAFRVVPVPPEGAVCGAGDLNALDCERAAGFREHAATLLPATQFDWRAGDVGVLAWRPLEPWPTGLRAPPPDPVVPVVTVWPPPALARTQADP